MVKSSRKAVLVMERKTNLALLAVNVRSLVKELVAAELERKCLVIDDTINRVYQVVPAKHTEEAIAEVKAVIMELVHSDLATLARELEKPEVELEVKPEPEPEVKPEPEVEVKPEPGKEQSKSMP